MQTVTLPSSTLQSSPASARPPGGLTTLHRWRQRIRNRRALAALHPEQIREAGLDPWCLREEIGKPFWRV